MRIKVDPDQLRSLAAQMRGVSNELSGLGGSVASAAGSLAWEARQRTNIDAQAQSAHAQANRLAGSLFDLARNLDERAGDFESADQQGQNAVISLQNRISALIEDWRVYPAARQQDLNRLVEGLYRLGELGLAGRETLARIAVITGIGIGSHYAGQVIVNIPDWWRTIGRIPGLGKFKSLREIRGLADLPKHLNHVAAASLNSIMLKEALRGSVKSAGLNWLLDAGRDIYYGATGQETVSRTVSAVAVDGVLAAAVIPAGLAGRVVGGFAGAAIGGAIGSVVPVFGTAAGAAIGQIAGQWIGGYLGERAARWAIEESGVRDVAIDWVDQNLAQPGLTSLERNFAQPIGSAVQSRVQAVEEACQGTATAILDAARELRRLQPPGWLSPAWSN